MLNHREGKEAVPYSLLHLVMSYMNLDKKIRYYGTDTPISNSEIHIISAIADNPEIHIRGLAEKLGITSASVSEMISRMQKKGLVEKRIDKKNLSRLNLFLTEKGKLAHREHRKYHDELNRMVNDELEGVSAEQIAFLNSFLENMAKRMNDFPF